MDEAVVTDIHTDVGNAAAAAEKYHVAGFEIGTVYLLAYGGHLGGSARQGDAHAAFEDILHEATAIEALGGGVATEAVGEADEAHGVHDEVAGFVLAAGGGAAAGR